VPTPSGVEEVVDRFAVKQLTERSWPGRAAAVVHGGTSFVRGWGLADLASGTPVTPQTGYRTGSTGKTQTAMAVMALAERGLLDLDDDVRKHVPAFDVSGPGDEPIRLLHLVTHTSGIGEIRDWADLIRPEKGIAVRQGQRPEPVNRLYRKGLRSPVAPGVVWRYANHAVTVLGAVIETHTGLPFERAVDELVFQPLGMRDTGFQPGWGSEPRTATGYLTRRRKRDVVPWREISIPPAGSAVSRADDMLLYLQALLGAGGNDQGRSVSPQTFSRMLARLHQPDPRQTGTGVMWWLNELDGHRVLRHGGSYPGFRSFCVAAPDDGVAVWLGLHDSDDDLERLGLELVRELLGAAPGVRELASLAAAAPAPSWLPPEGRYVAVGTALTTIGVWGAMRGGLTLTHAAGGEVWMRAPAWPRPLRLQHLGDGLFGTDAQEIVPLSAGFFTVQLLGTPEHPMLVANGRAVYARSRDPRPWVGLDSLPEAGIDELRAMLSDDTAAG
jgi:CubicO group peptidase (beta-lactamase class C family)